MEGTQMYDYHDISSPEKEERNEEFFENWSFDSYVGAFQNPYDDVDGWFEVEEGDAEELNEPLPMLGSTPPRLQKRRSFERRQSKEGGYIQTPENISQCESPLRHDPDTPIVQMEEKNFKRNIFAILAVCLIGEAARGLTVASLQLYMNYLGATTFLYTLTISIFSVGRMLGGMTLGALSNRFSIRTCIMTSMVICTFGNIMYFLAILFTPDPLAPLGDTENPANQDPTAGVHIVLVGRFLVGFGSSTVVLVRVYLSLITSPKERTKYVSWANASQFVGSSVLPGVGLILFLAPSFAIGELQITGYNSPGLLLAILDLLCIIIVYFFLTPISPQELHGDSPSKAPVVEMSPEQTKLQRMGAVLFFFFNFDTRSAVSFIETAGTVLFLRTMQPPCGTRAAGAHASFFFFILGLAGFFVFFLCDVLNKIISSLTLLASSFFTIGLGLFFLIDFGNYGFTPDDGEPDTNEPFDVVSGGNLIQHMAPWKFVLACVLIWSIGSPISQVMMISSFSRLLGQKPQGKWQGLIAMGGSFGRILSPLIVSAFLLDCWGCPDQPHYCYFDPDSDGDYDGKDNTNYIFYIATSMTFLALFMLLGFRYYLQNTSKGQALLSMINAQKS